MVLKIQTLGQKKLRTVFLAPVRAKKIRPKESIDDLNLISYWEEIPGLYTGSLVTFFKSPKSQIGETP